MGTSTAEMQMQSYRRTVYEIAQMIAPGWERPGED